MRRASSAKARGTKTLCRSAEVTSCKGRLSTALKVNELKGSPCGIPREVAKMSRWSPGTQVAVMSLRQRPGIAIGLTASPHVDFFRGMRTEQVSRSKRTLPQAAVVKHEEFLCM